MSIGYSKFLVKSLNHLKSSKLITTHKASKTFDLTLRDHPECPSNPNPNHSEANCNGIATTHNSDNTMDETYK